MASGEGTPITAAAPMPVACQLQHAGTIVGTGFRAPLALR